MDTIIGIKGADFVLLASDRSSAFSIVRLVDSEEKLLNLDDHKVLGSSGEHYDRVGFANLMQRNLELSYYRNGVRLDMP
jgi:20S proteasome alpha/beta subunit